MPPAVMDLGALGDLPRLAEGLLDGLGGSWPSRSTPFGRRLCPMPDEAWVVEFIGASAFNEPESYSSSESALTMGNELNDTEKDKVNAALTLLGSWKLSIIFTYLSELFREGSTSNLPGAGTLSAETGLADVIGRTYNHIRPFPGFAGRSFSEGSAPFVCKNSGDSPWYKLVWGEDSAVSNLCSALTQVDDPPDSFVFPLNWPDAMSLFLGGEERQLTLPDDAREKIEKIAAKLAETIASGDSAIEALSDTTDRISKILAMVAGLFAVGGAPLSTGLLLAVMGLISLGTDKIEDVWDAVRDILALLETNLKNSASASTSPFVNDAAARLLLAWAWIPQLFDDLPSPLNSAVGEDDFAAMFGLTLEEARLIWLQLHTELPTEMVGNELPDWYLEDVTEDWKELRKPLIHLDPDLFDYLFQDYANTDSDGGDDTGSWDEDAVPVDLKIWLEKASPTMQFARTLELASVLLEQLLNQECGWLALSRMALGEGLIGQIARAAMVEGDVTALSRIHGGVPLSRLFRFLWRQVMVDSYIGEWVAAGNSPDCLYEIFCWMQTEEQRATLDEVLGAPEVTNIAGSWSLYIRDFSSGPLGSILDAETIDAWWWGLSADQREALPSLVDQLDEHCYASWFPVSEDGSSASAESSFPAAPHWVDMLDRAWLREPIRVHLREDLFDFRRDWWRYGWDLADWRDMGVSLTYSTRLIPALDRSVLVLRGVI